MASKIIPPSTRHFVCLIIDAVGRVIIFVIFSFLAPPLDPSLGKFYGRWCLYCFSFLVIPKNLMNKAEEIPKDDFTLQ